MMEAFCPTCGSPFTAHILDEVVVLGYVDATQKEYYVNLPVMKCPN